ncbi:hypothetical protein AAG570_000901 [Ranatra chinensis]|uniref:Uncharacterized protein n=1 Tax=Ranatra chinensis TaxID=642074 RepID=A0ABD0YYF7_9HEMI
MGEQLVKETMEKRLSVVERSVFDEAIKKLVPKLKKCIEVIGDFVRITQVLTSRRESAVKIHRQLSESRISKKKRLRHGGAGICFQRLGVRNGQNKPGTASVSRALSSKEAGSSTSAEDVRSTYHRCEVRPVIKFINLRRESAAEIHRQLLETDGQVVNVVQRWSHRHSEL